MAGLFEAAWGFSRPYLETSRVFVNTYCQNLESWQIIAFTLGYTLIFLCTWDFIFKDESLKLRVRNTFFTIVRKIPIVQKKIAVEMNNAMKQMEDGFDREGTLKYIQKLPECGLSEEEILAVAQKYKEMGELDWTLGHISGGVYNGEDKLTQLAAKVYTEFAWTNPLHPEVFPDIRKMEAEVVSMTCNMFNGGPEACGTVTSGGTESILMAVKAYRDWGRARGITHPEIIVPVTVHAAFDKACNYFCLKIKHIPIDEETRKVDVRAMKKAITKNTVLLVGSAPCYPYGVIDPMKAISELGVRYGIPVHVDCCMGGFLVPFMRKCGFDIDFCDFRLPGVTSISADTHKYGFAPKGSSVIMYCNRDYRKYQYFVHGDWPGGIYASPTTAGSRPGSIIAMCWATLMYFGEKGYLNSTKKIINTAQYIESELRKIPELKVFGKPEVSIVSFTSDKFDIFYLFEKLLAKGWRLAPLQFPSSLHICVTLLHTKEGVVEKLIEDLKQSVAEIMKNPKTAPSGGGVLYGASQKVADRRIITEIVGSFFDVYYSTFRLSKRDVK